MLSKRFCCIVKRLFAVAILALAANTTTGQAMPTLLVLGDSLSAGHGIETTQGWVHLLSARLEDRPRPYRVVNASISGETTRGGLERLQHQLDTHSPEIVVVELGGNDGLRGLPLAETQRNLNTIVERALGAGARVLLVGIELPPNYGPTYTSKFRAIFGELATQFGVPLVPFLLEGVALEPGLMQADGLHPRAEAQPRLLDNVWPFLEPLLQ